jgi:hypothetical protein
VLQGFVFADVGQFQVLGHRAGPGLAFGDGLAQAVGRLGLAVHQIHVLWSARQRQHPVEQALLIGMT